MASLTSSILIPSVTASQVIGEQRIPLRTGTLSVSLPPPDTTSPATTEGSGSGNASGSGEVKLLLKIEPNLAIPLTSESVVGTNVERPLCYLFTLPMTSTSSSSSTTDPAADVAAETAFIELTLPETCNDPTTGDSTAATNFEQALVDHGFLTAGLVADADDMARSIKDAASRTAARIQGYTGKRISSDPVEPDEEARYSNVTKKVVGGTVEGTGKAAETTGIVTDAMGTAVGGAGEWVGGKVKDGVGAVRGDGGDGEEKKENEVDGFKSEAVEGVLTKDRAEEESIPTQALKQGMEATAVAAGGVGDGAAHVTHNIGSSLSTIAEHEKGGEAKELVDGARDATGNVGKVAKDLVIGTSTVWHAGEAGVGVAKGGVEEKTGGEEK